LTDKFVTGNSFDRANLPALSRKEAEGALEHQNIESIEET
jgi:hypothetical protein